MDSTRTSPTPTQVPPPPDLAERCPSLRDLYMAAELEWSEGEPAINVYTSDGYFGAHKDHLALTVLIPLTAPSTDFEGGGTGFWAGNSAVGEDPRGSEIAARAHRRTRRHSRAVEAASVGLRTSSSPLLPAATRPLLPTARLGRHFSCVPPARRHGAALRRRRDARGAAGRRRAALRLCRFLLDAHPRLAAGSCPRAADGAVSQPTVWRRVKKLAATRAGQGNYKVRGVRR